MDRNTNRLSNGLSNTSSRRQALKLMGSGLVGGLAMATGIKGIAAKPNRGPNILEDLTLTGVFEDGSAFEGLLTISQLYENPEGGLLADGWISSPQFDEGEVESFEQHPMMLSRHEFMGSMQNKLAFAGQTSDAPVGAMAQDAGSCDILFLQLGPLELDLLGLVVELDQVTLNIDAQRGPGNLLGNLLCAVAGLLDGGGGGLQGLLRQINSILSDLLGG